MNLKDKKMDPEYGHEINPISRLIQVLQAQKKGEPKFELIAERGQNRYKEFVMEVIFQNCDVQINQIFIVAEGKLPHSTQYKRKKAECFDVLIEFRLSELSPHIERKHAS